MGIGDIFSGEGGSAGVDLMKGIFGPIGGMLGATFMNPYEELTTDRYLADANPSYLMATGQAGAVPRLLEYPHQANIIKMQEDWYNEQKPGGGWAGVNPANMMQSGGPGGGGGGMMNMMRFGGPGGGGGGAQQGAMGGALGPAFQGLGPGLGSGGGAQGPAAYGSQLGLGGSGLMPPGMFI